MIVLGVDDFVPKRVKLINTIVVGQGEGVGSLVALWELRVVADLVVERLDEVTYVVDKKAQSV